VLLPSTATYSVPAVGVRYACHAATARWTPRLRYRTSCELSVGELSPGAAVLRCELLCTGCQGCCAVHAGCACVHASACGGRCLLRSADSASWIAAAAAAGNIGRLSGPASAAHPVLWEDGWRSIAALCMLHHAADTAGAAGAAMHVTVTLHPAQCVSHSCILLALRQRPLNQPRHAAT
jgi:hypothetical protein